VVKWAISLLPIIIFVSQRWIDIRFSLLFLSSYCVLSLTLLLSNARYDGFSLRILLVGTVRKSWVTGGVWGWEGGFSEMWISAIRVDVAVLSPNTRHGRE
jgi:hypothetical protein